MLSESCSCNAVEVKVEFNWASKQSSVGLTFQTTYKNKSLHYGPIAVAKKVTDLLSTHALFVKIPFNLGCPDVLAC